MKLNWEKVGELYDRVYTATGLRGAYRIDLDKTIDRWVIYVNNMKRVEDVYYVTDAKRIARGFDASGVFDLPPDLRPRPDRRIPHII